MSDVIDPNDLGLDPETLELLFKSGAFGDQNKALDKQGAHIEALRNFQTPGADPLSALATVGSRIKGEVLAQRQDKARQGLIDQQTAASRAFYESLTGKRRQPGNPEAPLGFAAPVGTGEAGTDGWGY